MAKAGKGRFSAEAKDVLDKAVSDGVIFDEPVVKPVSSKPKVIRVIKEKAPSKDLYDAKDVRSWAEQTGLVEKGKRGRLPAEVISAYLAQNISSPVEKKTVRVSTRIRPESVGWTFAKRGDRDAEYISEPLVAVTSCGDCSKGIAYCGCASGPMAPKYLGRTVLLLTRPSV
jgi:hypothetical protein